MRTDNVVSPLSRALLGAIFVSSGLSKLRDRPSSLGYMRMKGMTFATEPLLTAATAVELIGGAALLLGIGSRPLTALMAAYLVPTSFIFHDFWRQEGMEKQNQMIHFMKNLSIIGGLLTVSQHGAGSVSIENRFFSPRVSTEGFTDVGSEATSESLPGIARHERTGMAA